jgi:hypothetical protein
LKVVPPQQAFVASISDSAETVKAASQILSTCAIAFGAWSLLREGAVEQVRSYVARRALSNLIIVFFTSDFFWIFELNTW